MEQTAHKKGGTKNEEFKAINHDCISTRAILAVNVLACLASYDVDGRSHDSLKKNINKFPLGQPSCCLSTMWYKLCGPQHWNSTARPNMAVDGSENEGLCLRQLPPPSFRISQSYLRELPLPVSSMTEHGKSPLKLPNNSSGFKEILNKAMRCAGGGPQNASDFFKVSLFCLIFLWNTTHTQRWAQLYTYLSRSK